MAAMQHVALHETVPVPTLKIPATTSSAQGMDFLTPRSLAAAEKAVAEQEAMAAEAEEAATCLTARAAAAAQAARVPGSSEEVVQEARASAAAASAALSKAVVTERAVAKTIGTFLLLSHRGWSYGADKFGSEPEARSAAAALWSSWVLFHEQRGALTEVAHGGYGFGHGALRKYAKKGTQMALNVAMTGGKGFYSSIAQ